MKRDFFDPSIEQVQLVAIGAQTLREAERIIETCEYCNQIDAEIPFDWIIDRVVGRRGSTTDYIFAESARCPNCKHEVTEKTLIEPKDE